MFSLAIVCCSSDDDGGGSAPVPAPERFDTAAAFVDALGVAGVACENFEEDEPTPPSVGFPGGISAGTCGGGLDVASSAGALEIDLYATGADAKEAVTATLDLLACNDSAPEYDLLRGANWTVLGSPDGIDEVRAARGGEVTTLCD